MRRRSAAMRASALATSSPARAPSATASSTPRIAARAGCQLHRGEGTPRAADAREDEVRVADARAVPGEVLPAREHAGAREPACERDAQTGDPGRVGPEGAVADHAVARVRPHVEHR